MKTLEQIKDEVAINCGHCDFISMYNCDAISTVIIDEIAKTYAQQCCEDLRQRSADNTKNKVEMPNPYAAVHQSILNTEIILP